MKFYRYFLMPASLILQSKSKFMLNNVAICPVNTKPQNKHMHCQISPRRTCNPCGYTKISSMYHRLLIYDAKHMVWVPLLKLNLKICTSLVTIDAFLEQIPSSVDLLVVVTERGLGCQGGQHQSFF